MKNVVAFLKKFKDFLLFLLIQTALLTSFFNSKNYHKAIFVNTSNFTTAWFIEKKYNIVKHFNLENENAALIEENALLRSKLPISFYQLQNRIYYINDTLYEQQYHYIPANVINSTQTNRNNYFTLNKGSLQGIEKMMGVISNKGLVGFVVDVSDHYSIVKSVLSENININVKLENNKAKGILKWDGKNNKFCQLHGVTSDNEIFEGDKVVTLGSAGIFPEGIPVGTIDKKDFVSGANTLFLNIKLDEDYMSLFHVYIIKNLFKKEKTKLEEIYFDE